MLKSGLRHGELFLEYQPIVDLANGRWVGVEALCRWRRRNGEPVRPEVFIPAAEEAGIIHLVTTRVLAQIAQDLPRIVALDSEFHVAVNLSADDLYASDTVPLLRATVSASGVDARHLQIEVTERGFMRTDAAREAVRAIRGIGIRVAVDDFGTGYSSLSYLELFELDLLKIDKSFVDTIGQGAATSQVVPHIIEMAKSLRLQMVAEGIESQAQADYLGQRGVRYGQGWLYARPMPLEILLQRLRQLRERPAIPPSPHAG
jgi:sensor c-di-GMP phosphodiesterase-like protein